VKVTSRRNLISFLVLKTNMCGCGLTITHFLTEKATKCETVQLRNGIKNISKRTSRLYMNKYIFKGTEVKCYFGNVISSKVLPRLKLTTRFNLNWQTLWATLRNASILDFYEVHSGVASEGSEDLGDALIV